MVNGSADRAGYAFMKRRSQYTRPAVFQQVLRRFPLSPAILKLLLRSHKCCLKLSGSIFLPPPFRHTYRQQFLKVLSQAL